MANTPKVIRKNVKKGATEMRAARNDDAGLPKTSAQKTAQKSVPKSTMSRVSSGNIGANRSTKQAAADKAKVKGVLKEFNNPSMKLKAAQAKKKAAKTKTVANKLMLQYFDII